MREDAASSSWSRACPCHISPRVTAMSHHAAAVLLCLAERGSAIEARSNWLCCPLKLRGTLVLPSTARVLATALPPLLPRIRFTTAVVPIVHDYAAPLPFRHIEADCAVKAVVIGHWYAAYELSLRRSSLYLYYYYYYCNRTPCRLYRNLLHAPASQHRQHLCDAQLPAGNERMNETI